MGSVIPMTGRMIHHLDGSCESQQYDLDKRAINSIDRGFLNNLLLDAIGQCDNITTVFNAKFETMDLGDKPTLRFTDSTSEFDFIIGADGVFSRVRQQLQKFIRMDFHQEFIDCAYLELSIAAGGSNKFKIDKNHLHIWPRHNFMLIALPNEGGSFTSTFFGPWELLESLDSDQKITEFFHMEFPDAVELITEEKLLDAFHNHPKGQLLSISCSQYHFKDKCLIIGDAAHAMVPFYGQGMNCGFEDVRVLLKLLEEDEASAFERYSEVRHEDLTAIVELAKENYKEMSHKVTSKLFLLRKKVDFLLTYYFRDKWIPLYTMVTFRTDISYSQAVARVERQDQILKILQTGVIGISFFAGWKAWRIFSKK